MSMKGLQGLGPRTPVLSKIGVPALQSASESAAPLVVPELKPVQKGGEAPSREVFLYRTFRSFLATDWVGLLEGVAAGGHPGPLGDQIRALLREPPELDSSKGRSCYELRLVSLLLHTVAGFVDGEGKLNRTALKAAHPGIGDVMLAALGRYRGPRDPYSLGDIEQREMIRALDTVSSAYPALGRMLTDGIEEAPPRLEAFDIRARRNRG